MLVSIGTDCSGIDAPIEALKQLKVEFLHKFSCESDKFARMSIQANHNPETLYTDITTRDHDSLPCIDIYVCGFPCQPFSSLGKRLGRRDKRGNIMEHCIQTIKAKCPKVFILENVKNFKIIHNGEPHQFLMRRLVSLGTYSLYDHIFNTKHYGIPHNRERVFIIGIRKDVELKPFTIPKQIAMKPITKFLVDKKRYNFPLSQYTERQLLTKYNKKLEDFSDEYIISRNRSAYFMKGVVSTLTTWKLPYLIRYRRYLYPFEGLLLQGFRKSFKVVVSNSQLTKQVGNTMSVNVLKAIFRNVFESVNLGG
jgi:DNA (cytosine-5)-methyltransferase 1